MKTPWTDKVDFNAPFPEYPRPQMVRDNWVNLNGRWEYAITQSNRQPKEYDGFITVPFSPETELSGVKRRVTAKDWLWYRRPLYLPETFSGRRVILHFGAVDQEAAVWVNDKLVMSHNGGYLPFEADITDALDANNIIVVRVKDHTDRSWHTRGKQKTRRGGIWYTPQSGIWQSVWAESVPEDYVRRLTITPQFDNKTVSIDAETVGDAPAYAHFGGVSFRLPAIVPVPDCEPWTPETPNLYSFSVTCGDDRVDSYFAMRKFSVDIDGNGTPRLMLNNKPYFHNGLLDQGYWPDGLYTAPTDDAMIFDISTAKSMGFNMLRKHIKIEPLRWYYHCDRLGMLVWQDMPCGGGAYSPAIVSAPLVTGIHIKDNAYSLFGRGNPDGRKEFEKELIETVRHLINCPCIAMWVPFNEGWGQFDSARMCDMIRAVDTTRTIDHASGWHDQHIGDTKSLHVYFRAYRFRPDKLGRAVLLSEFGGYNHSVNGHCYNKKDFGYKSLESPAQLESALKRLYAEQIAPAYERGLAAAVYTQLSDVEDELNGIVTYDRKVVKLAPEIMKSIVKVEHS